MTKNHPARMDNSNDIAETTAGPIPVEPCKEFGFFAEPAPNTTLEAPSPTREGRPRNLSPAVKAVADIERILRGLKPEEVVRVMRWLEDKFPISPLFGTHAEAAR